ncbi:SUF system Fe-S cluster assembly protein [Noviherbaspirillum cavernae]|uniref:SUF system Fe-S cluster assembly protein n=1 Tax=Noviherbaspirillum cavernae TaxID=2320862 RepID=A0A418X2F9_9BURK|nr:SUF system Fe-S cluster assembly protein [Noviherbaspirillum cavernae]RJG06649.1 SUF system Fe-S cluster assembly protein [Noviherbaspirillum cavernae]
MTIFDWLKKAEESGAREIAAANAPVTPAIDAEMLRQDVIQALRQIYDPEIPVNIYDLGLIYELDVDEAGAARIRMTLTSPACPVAQSFPETVECAVNGVPGVTQAQVELVWDPPWSREMMSETAMLELGLL